MFANGDVDVFVTCFDICVVVVVVCVDFNIWYLGSCHWCPVVVIFVFVDAVPMFDNIFD